METNLSLKNRKKKKVYKSRLIIVFSLKYSWDAIFMILFC